MFVYVVLLLCCFSCFACNCLFVYLWAWVSGVFVCDLLVYNASFGVCVGCLVRWCCCWYCLWVDV